MGNEIRGNSFWNNKLSRSTLNFNFPIQNGKKWQLKLGF